MQLPSWFRVAAPAAEPLDYLALARDVADSPATVETRHYILCLLHRIEDEHAFRRAPLTMNELEAYRLLKGYLEQIDGHVVPFGAGS